MTTYVDAVGAVREWINGQTATLVGAGHPLQLGASLNLREGGGVTVYGYLLEITGFLWAGHETPSMGARLSLQIYGPTKQAASDGAVAYADALMPLLQGQRVFLTAAGVWLVGAADIEGPQWLPAGNDPRYVVDASYLFA